MKSNEVGAEIDILKTVVTSFLGDPSHLIAEMSNLELSAKSGYDDGYYCASSGTYQPDRPSIVVY
eukprot:scaffold18043_cov46-Attheya_sp.AAC.2